jgi:hypothetical protein
MFPWDTNPHVLVTCCFCGKYVKFSRNGVGSDYTHMRFEVFTVVKICFVIWFVTLYNLLYSSNILEGHLSASQKRNLHP